MSDTPDDSRVPPPPGWYQDPQTQEPRWWDGAEWGPVAATRPASPGANTALAVIAHLGGLVFPIVVPLVVYFTAGKDDADVRHHAREAVNFQITFLIVWLAGVVIVFTSFGLAASRSANAPPTGFFVAFGGMFVLYFTALGFAVYGGVQAGRGQRWRYPVSLRLVGRHESA